MILACFPLQGLKVSVSLYDHTDTAMLLVNVVCYPENQKQKLFLTDFRISITAETDGNLIQNFS